MNVLETILNIVFPVNCVSCGKRNSDLCFKCLSESREAERESADWIFPLFDYRHIPIKKSIWLLKYKNKKRIANVFAEVMYGRIIEELSELSIMKDFKNAILIPIPLSTERYKERGYNQAVLICQELIKLDEKNNGEKNFVLEKNILIKIKDTEHQANIKERRDRLKNLIGSFAIKNSKENLEKIKNRNIILIDDVTTTGATLNEAKKILKQSGARKIIAFTIAH
jgi:competence protein ComFC